MFNSSYVHLMPSVYPAIISKNGVNSTPCTENINATDNDNTFWLVVTVEPNHHQNSGTEEDSAFEPTDL